MNKNIANIVFYQENNGEKKACIFYDNGTVEENDYETAIDKCYNLAKEMKINSKDLLKEMINNKVFHVVTKSQFLKNYNNYIVVKTVAKEEIREAIEENIEKEEDNIPKVPVFEKRAKSYLIQGRVHF